MSFDDNWKIYCPLCKRKVGTYDGKSMIPKIYKCNKCKKRVLFKPEEKSIEIKPIPQRNCSSGMTFI